MSVPSNEQIEVRAYEIFLERGGEPGRDLEDWLAAEKELHGRHAEIEAIYAQEKPESAQEKARLPRETPRRPELEYAAAASGRRK
jgi:hypothetical protein